jgi:predicted ATPase/DNA-binding CsgD family transcriptional regulator
MSVSARGAVGRLPAEVTSFVGRKAELAEVRQLLSTARLVTLTGAGGAGKTRLAVRAGRELRRAFPDGVWHVELGTLSDRDLVEYAVVETLRLGGSAELSATGLLTDYLADRELMLVLDNCEHLLDACAALVITLLRTCPGLRILCTSRQPLGVIGEALFTVPPLDVPVNGTTMSAAGRRYSAVSLFVERAFAVQPGFALGPHNEVLVADICARLDGLPLAIELAAARLRTLTVEQLAAGLADRFGILTTRHAVPVHHRRLRDTFGWSFELCSPAERALWCRLAVFDGSFDLDAAGAVCASDDLPEEALLDTVGELVDKSIVVREELAGQVRYRLLETVREYGLSRLPAAGSGLMRRHRDWYLRLATRFAAEWFGPDQVGWAARLRAEWANLRTALGWSLSTPGETEGSLRLSAALEWFWLGCGALAEGRLWLDRALAAPDGAETVTRARAMSVRTRVLITQADHAAAAASAEETLALAHTLDDPFLLARAAYDAGAAIFTRAGPLDRAQEHLDDARARFDALGIAPLDHAMALTTLAYIMLHNGDPDRAEGLCAGAREACRRRGERWWLSYTLLASAEVAFSRGDIAEGEHRAREALPMLYALGADSGVVAALDDLAYAAAASDDLDRAACLLGAGTMVAKPIGQDATERRRYWRGFDSLFDGLRATLGDTAFDAAFQRGEQMSQEAVFGYALGVDQTPGGLPAPRTPSTAPLTRRERQVAALIAQGLSNHQIAGRLVISQRTAESHVENILTKLGFGSRAQVATWYTRQRDADQDGA